VLLALIERLVDRRLDAKRTARSAPAGSRERHTHEALSAAMKIVVNSAYGYLGAVGLTRFADVHAANEVTRHGRELLELLCRELAARGVTLLEADTDGVYFSVPDTFTEADERRVVAEVAALLPERVQLELEGRYAAMLSHEPKNYALLPRGGSAFLRRALESLLRGDVVGVRSTYVDAVMALRHRRVPTGDVTARVRLTKTPAEYLATRARRRELAYEAALSSGRAHWSVGERLRIYRAVGGRGAVWADPDDDKGAGLDDVPADARDYDVEYYLRLLRDTFAARLARALTPEDYALVFADPEQPSLFQAPLAGRRPILTRVP
jgi:DNA polymerase I